MHIIDNIMDKNYSLSDNKIKIISPHDTSYFGKKDLSHYQIEIDEEARHTYTINISQGLFKKCRLLQGLKSSFSILQNWIESTPKRINCVGIFQDDMYVYETTEENFDKRLFAVKSGLCGEKTLLVMRKNLTIALVSWYTALQGR